jgi:hypothetical protein
MTDNRLIVQLIDNIQMIRGEDDYSVYHECERAKAAVRKQSVTKRHQLNELLLAAQSVIDRWDSPSWKDLPATADYIHRLRKAVADMETKQ